MYIAIIKTPVERLAKVVQEEVAIVLDIVVGVTRIEESEVGKIKKGDRVVVETQAKHRDS